VTALLPSREPYDYPVYIGPPAYLPDSLPMPDGPRCVCGYVHDGKCPARKGKFEPQPPMGEPMREYERPVRQATVSMWADDPGGVPSEPVAAVDVIAPAPPRVPARAPAGPTEIAGYGGKQAVGLGRRAAAAGWNVEARYWVAGDGTEGCAVRLACGELRAVATWQRKAPYAGTGSGWGADVAYAWRVDVDAVPTKLNHTELERIMDV
jgi:hypothetical protein